MIARLRFVVNLLGIILLAGCGDSTKNDVSKERLEQMSGGTLKPTVPVSGKVLVDGVPQSGVDILLYSTTGEGPIANCRTGENGEYCWSTYTTCDGLPAASYLLGFSYVPKQKKNDTGIDVFKEKYGDPMDNYFPLDVLEGMPQVHANFELKTN